MNIRFAAAVVAAGLVVVLAAAAAPGSGSVVPRSAHPLGTAPATIQATADAGLAADAPVPACAGVSGVAWYTVNAPHRGAMVARVVAGGELDAAVAVYRIVRSVRTPVVCAKTNTHGRVRVAWYAYSEGSYLVGVARRTGSAVGPYTLSLLVADRAPQPPGVSLPAAGGTGTINSVLNTADAWSLQLDRGVTYKVNVTSAGAKCLDLAIYRPGIYAFRTATPVYATDCARYTLFTPGLDGGGVYSLVVSDSSGEPTGHFYRLQVARAGPDDTAPGVALANGQYVSGTIDGRALDAVDLFRFTVPHQNELTTLDLRQARNAAFDLLLLDETGGRIAYACNGITGRQVLRQHIPPGHYYVAVRSNERSTGGYGLQLFVRDVTTTGISVAGGRYAEVAPATPVPVAVQVTSASHGGPVVIEFDRHDPLSGWQFAGSVRVQVDATGGAATTWLPPAVGHWRARARFVGTPFSNFSQSGYVQIHVAEPLE